MKITLEQFTEQVEFHLMELNDEIETQHYEQELIQSYIEGFSATDTAVQIWNSHMIK